MDARRALLGLPDNATAEDIRRSYLAMAKRCHPDARGGSAEAFRALSDAYESLLQQPDPRAGGARPAGARGGSVLHHRAVFHPSRGNTLAFCGLSLLVGCGIYAGALSLHMNTDMYGARRFVPTAGDERLRLAVEARTAGRRLSAQEAEHGVAAPTALRKGGQSTL